MKIIIHKFYLNNEKLNPKKITYFYLFNIDIAIIDCSNNHTITSPAR
ncbi:hypothetical protein XBKQ1_1280063 [Xenorhabdus bovienii str. kraussei Quebec]|uniref:Uncharacterized protein n=1 Tax=Xenorhabdus bovienii str. kraussei Quebec TaxID=1398203 RepID=A0A077PCW9_XENBV|nr:hypothetical protein XBKQ1_1280063 [Xenorhabdus bovienii str. kraussei Quebec]